jgi:hypothetical protein
MASGAKIVWPIPDLTNELPGAYAVAMRPGGRMHRARLTARPSSHKASMRSMRPCCCDARNRADAH